MTNTNLSFTNVGQERFTIPIHPSFNVPVGTSIIDVVGFEPITPAIATVVHIPVHVVYRESAMPARIMPHIRQPTFCTKGIFLYACAVQSASLQCHPEISVTDTNKNG